MPYKAKSDLTKAAIKKSFLGLWLQQKHDLLSL